MGPKTAFDTQTVLPSPEGRFEFHSVPRGNYEIFPSVRGYSLPGDKFTMDVTVDRDRNDFDLTLDPTARR